MQEISADTMFQEWADNRTRPVYCLAGEERSFKADALEKLLSGFNTDAFNFSQYDGETADINDLVSAAMTPSFAGGTRLILFKSAEKLKKEQAQRLAEYLQNPSNATILLILLDKKTDSAELIIKTLPASAALINFAPLEGVQAAMFVKKMLEREGLSASQEALELLVETAGSDAMTIKNEAAKLSAWRHGGKKTLEPEDIMESAGFSKTLNPFAFSNALLAKNGPLAADLADSMLREGVEAVGLVVAAAYITEKLLKVKKLSGDASGKSSVYALGLSPGYYRRLLEASKPFTPEKLLKNLNRCLEMEAMLKSSSGRDPGLLVKQLIFEITR
ncbi:MAG: DNA polymerase III subunit delta [Elusimicrobia bacterium]|nr:DNA polymerase III subunit delta [Elusimicrobiota bacterium]